MTAELTSAATVDRAFWRGRRVLVTGHTGFKGAWLSLWMQELGAEVVGFGRAPPTRPSLFELAGVGERMASLTGDVRDLEAVRSAVEAHRPEVVFHLAAQSTVRRSYSEPAATFATNVMGTVHVLEAIRRTPSVRAAVIVTSDKCYENREWVWPYRENEPMGGFDPYSGSKGCAEIVTAAYRRSFFGAPGAAIATARAGNVIGGGDWAEDRLVPDILRAFLERRAVPIRSPHAVRPWQHVVEPLAGYLLLAERLVQDGHAFAEAWNFGPADDDARPVSWIVERMAALWGPGTRWQADEGPHPHEAGCLKLDCSKARDRLGWRPRGSLEAALRMIVEWHKAYERGDDIRAVTLAQLGACSPVGE